MGRWYTRYEDVLADPEVDAVHINSPIPDHGWMSLAALSAGKHVACTVPMATTTQECRKIVEMAATHGAQVHDDGDDRLRPGVPVHQATCTVPAQLGQAAVPAGQSPPGHGRLARLLAGASADVVRHPLCRPDAGPHRCHRRIRILLRVRDHPRRTGGKVRVAVRGETAHIRLRGSDLTARIYRSLFDTARQYRESIDVFGSKQSFEWR